MSRLASTLQTFSLSCSLPVMEDIALCGVSSCLALVFGEKSRKRKRWWCREVLEEGPKFGMNLLEKLRLEDAMGFRNFTRLTPTDFEELLLMVGERISKKDTRFRQTIPASLRLAVTLRFLASGDSFTSLMYTFRISKQAISQIVPEVCEAIIHSLKTYVKVSVKRIILLINSLLNLIIATGNGVVLKQLKVFSSKTITTLQKQTIRIVMFLSCHTNRPEKGKNSMLFISFECVQCHTVIFFKNM